MSWALTGAVDQIAPDSPVYRWAGLVLGQFVLFAGVVVTYLTGRRSEKKSDTAAEEAKKAATAVAPVSNGFAGKTAASLTDIQELIKELKAETKEVKGLMISHISDHASSDLRKN